MSSCEKGRFMNVSCYYYYHHNDDNKRTNNSLSLVTL